MKWVRNAAVLGINGFVLGGRSEATCCVSTPTPSKGKSCSSRGHEGSDEAARPAHGYGLCMTRGPPVVAVSPGPRRRRGPPPWALGMAHVEVPMARGGDGAPLSRLKQSHATAQETHGWWVSGWVGGRVGGRGSGLQLRLGYSCPGQGWDGCARPGVATLRVTGLQGQGWKAIPRAQPPLGSPHGNWESPLAPAPTAGGPARGPTDGPLFWGLTLFSEMAEPTGLHFCGGGCQLWIRCGKGQG